MELLFELYCEELPASYLDKAIETLPEQLTKKLTDLRAAPESVRATGTPRRIVLHATGLPREQRSSSEELTGLPSKRRMTSPGSTPAFSAGPPFSTELTRAPWTLGRPNPSASSLVIGWITTPIRPRVTLPDERSCWATSWPQATS